MPVLGKGRKRLWSYLSLLFSLFYLLPLFLTDGLSEVHIFGALLIYLLFLCAYVFAINSPNKYRALAILVLICVSISAVPFTIGGLSLFGYSFFLMAYYWPLKHSATSTLALIALMLLIPILLSNFIWQFIIPVIISSIALYIFGVMEQRETLHNIALEQSHESVKKLSAIAERERIGRDLHDIAGHALSGISLKAQLASKLLSKNRIDKAKQEVDQLAVLSQDLLAEIRKAVSNIKALSLLDEIDKIEKTLLENTIKLKKNIDESSIAALNPKVESILSLVLKEAVTNILRHSNASIVIISISNNANSIFVAIKDNGDTQAQQKIHHGNGIIGMRERAELVGGNFSIDFRSGCSVEIKIPLVDSSKQSLAIY